MNEQVLIGFNTSIYFSDVDGKCEGISLTFSAGEDLGDGMISVRCDNMHRFRLRLKAGESSEDVCKSLENLAKFIREDLNAK